MADAHEGVRDPGSFRDRHARVFHSGGRIYRAIGQKAAEESQRLSRTRFLGQHLREGTIVPTEESASGEFPHGAGGQWFSILTHARIPFISCPYEWSFGMLKDAALLHLDLMSAALDVAPRFAAPRRVETRPSAESL